MRINFFFVIVFLFAIGFPRLAHAQTAPKSSISNQEKYFKFYSFFTVLESEKEKSIDWISKNWEDEFALMILETIYLSKDKLYNKKLIDILQSKTGQQYGNNFDQWYHWLWSKEQNIFHDYGDFKAMLYSLIDEKFETYFKDRTSSSSIRLDEVRWGGVPQDGIPPLRSPTMIKAAEATYLEDDNVVFGISINGDVRAYPKRILAWHEMFVDEIGGLDIAGVYCTLCGTVVIYETKTSTDQYELGTSGFLYRSNKLMYDKATQSLWNTIWGKPVIGPLAGKGIELVSRQVVTTTWGAWKSRHPDTQVLSLETGHQRDYSEGTAYRNYFATDRLMFSVPKTDSRLKNKEEVVIVRMKGYESDPIAISSKYLSRKKIYHNSIDSKGFVVLTDKSGANRVYETKSVRFKSYDQGVNLEDSEGVHWTLSEDQLESEKGDLLKTVPYHRSFWFGWFASYPNTRLIYK